MKIDEDNLNDFPNMGVVSMYHLCYKWNYAM